MKLKIFVAAVCITLSIPAAAQDREVLEAVMARQALMSYIGGNMKTLAGMSRGSADFNQTYVSNTGKAINAMALALPSLFPLGSESGGDTEAGPMIFSDPLGFASATKQLADAGTTLAATDSTEELRAAFGALAGTCKSCHTLYREKK